MIDRRSEEHLTAGFVFVAGFDHGHDESLSESSSNTENLNDFTDNSVVAYADSQLLVLGQAKKMTVSFLILCSFHCLSVYPYGGLLIISCVDSVVRRLRY